MKKILLIIIVATSFVACKKDSTLTGKEKVYMKVVEVDNDMNTTTETKVVAVYVTK